MQIERIGRCSVKMTFLNDEIKTIEHAVTTYGSNLSSRLLIGWLIIIAHKEGGLRINDKKITVELIRNNTEAVLYVSSDYFEYRLAPRKKYNIRLKKEKQLICYFDKTDKLIKFSKFICNLNCSFRHDTLYSNGKDFILSLKDYDDIPLISLGEFSENSIIKSNHHKITNDFHLIISGGAIRTIAGL